MGIIIAGAIAVGLAFLTIGTVMLRATPPADRRLLAVAFLIALPLQPLVFYAVRLPIDALVRSFLGLTVTWGLVAVLYAPFTEEPAKWLPLALPSLRRKLTPANAVPLALAIGLGFGIGEICFLTRAVILSPNYPDLPFWQFYGFILERVEICFLHGVFVAAPVVGLVLGRSFWPGAIVGVLLHLLVNFPIFLAQLGAFGLSGRAWSLILIAWLVAAVVAGAVVLCRLHHRLTRAAQKPAQ